ncbi:hypothetical protein BHE74_00026121 [Ensete ventricosum]|nr:hypothetical protein GW17_00022586 [Ensete ventricosum]RWW66498.1 hypothetical protein BHE74_00026121 [Ensete ventricosum]
MSSIWFSVKEANMLVFVTPHQFVAGICKRLVGKIKPNTEAISLIKGMEVKTEGPCMISKLITDMLGINCCIAVEKFSEATIGYRQDKEFAQRWARLFCTPYFLVSVQDVEGVELCGTLKNVVAIAAVGGRNRKHSFISIFCISGFNCVIYLLKGVSTAKEVYEILSHRGWQAVFPLFTTVHEICIGQLPSSAIVEYSEQATNFSIVEGLAQYC